MWKPEGHAATCRRETHGQSLPTSGPRVRRSLGVPELGRIVTLGCYYMSNSELLRSQYVSSYRFIQLRGFGKRFQKGRVLSDFALERDPVDGLIRIYH